jgi:hypothetical protein
MEYKKFNPKIGTILLQGIELQTTSFEPLFL